MGKYIRPVLLIAFSLILMLDIGLARADGTRFNIDQSATGAPITWQINIEYAQVGQEFTPRLQGINFVELQMQDGDCWTLPPLHPNDTVQVKLRLHWNSISGPVIASSVTASLAPCFDDIARFQFPYVVRFLPNRRYVLEVAYAGGRGGIINIMDTDVYPGGRFITNGNPIPGSDMWFREGLNLPLATSLSQCQSFDWLNTMRLDGSLFWSRLQCQRYVNFGV